MPTNYYFLKLHFDILDDWKVGTLPDSLKWLFIQCLCVAGECQEEGLLPELNQFAYRIRKEPSALNSDMARLAANQLAELVQVEDGPDRWFLTNYEKRQAKISDAQKQKDYRTRQRKAENVTPPLPSRYDTVTTRNTEENRIDIDLEEIREEKKPTPAKKPKQLVIIPDSLNTPAFVATWNDFQEHRKEVKSKMTPRSANMQLKKLGEYSPDIAIAMMEQSITNGWKAVFELKQSDNGNGPSRAQIRENQSIDAIDRAFDDMEAKGLI